MKKIDLTIPLVLLAIPFLPVMPWWLIISLLIILGVHCIHSAIEQERNWKK